MIKFSVNKKAVPAIRRTLRRCYYEYSVYECDRGADYLVIETEVKEIRIEQLLCRAMCEQKSVIEGAIYLTDEELEDSHFRVEYLSLLNASSATSLGTTKDILSNIGYRKEALSTPHN